MVVGWRHGKYMKGTGSGLCRVFVYTTSKIRTPVLALSPEFTNQRWVSILGLEKMVEAAPDWRLGNRSLEHRAVIWRNLAFITADDHQ
jgi:hypothetical protein